MTAQPGTQVLPPGKTSSTTTQKLSILHGPTDPPLLDLTLGDLLDLQTAQHGARECLVIPWTGARWTYADLSAQSTALARSLIADLGVEAGDRVAVMAGNCEQYAALFFAVARVGAVLVILNNTYTAREAMYGLEFTGSKVLFTTSKVGRLDNGRLLSEIEKGIKGRPRVVMLRGDEQVGRYTTYDELVKAGQGKSDDELHEVASRVMPHQVVNLQFTSGTTGLPKAAMLTHHNIVNNARFIGDRMRLTPSDVLCCPPPLFHCFGLVLGLLAVVTHGSKIVYPAEVFDPSATLRAIVDEECTALHGVPAMFDSLFAAASPDFRTDRLRTGIVAGAPVPRAMMERMVARLGMREFTSSYGLTEASPTCFNAHTDDDMARRLSTVGTLMPHAKAKIVDREGIVVPVGTRGELCIAGYQLQAGYWNNSEKTNEAMVRDADGVLWLRTGDEAMFDEQGYCTITGRFKDIIIRGGENIYPLEIEERLSAHPSISRAVVVGLKDKHYGEVAAAFLEHDSSSSISGTNQATAPVTQTQRLSDDQVRDWVRQSLGRHKAPAHVFWLGEGGVPGALPLTGSGKVKKYEMARLGEGLLGQRAQTSKL